VADHCICVTIIPTKVPDHCICVTGSPKVNDLSLHFCHN